MVFQLTDKLAFPDPHYGDPDGLLAVGGDLSIGSVDPFEFVTEKSDESYEYSIGYNQ